MSDAHVTAIATIIQDVLLLLSAGLISWYLWETRQMRQAAQQQVAASLKQVEATLLPAVVVKTSGQSLDPPFLVNIGNGPAVEVEWSLSNSSKCGKISYLEQHEQTKQLFEIKTLYNASLQVTPNAASIHCKYRSVSGKTYSSENAYDFEHERFITTFTVGEAGS